MSLFWPGLMDLDNIQQYEQVRIRIIQNTIQPPAYVWLWMQLYTIIPGPTGLFLFNQLLFWFGLILFALSQFQRTHHRLSLIAIVAFFPTLLAWQGWVLKDVATLSVVMLMIGLLCWLPMLQKNLKTACITVICFLFIFCCVIRGNNILLIAPLSLWLITELYSQSASPLRKAAYGVLMLGFIISVTFLVNAAFRQLYHLDDARLEQQSMVLDLANLSVQHHIMLLPEESFLHPDFSVEDLKGIHDLLNVVPYYWGSDDKKRLAYHARDNEAYLTALKAHWLDAITTYPVDYIRNRLSMATYLFGIGEGKVCGRIDHHFVGHKAVENPWGFGFKGNSLTPHLLPVLDRLSFTPLSMGFVYVIIHIIGLFVAIQLYRKQGHLHHGLFWISSGSLIWMSAYVIITPVCFFRLLLPGILTALIVSVFLLKITHDFWQKRYHNPTI